MPARRLAKKPAETGGSPRVPVYDSLSPEYHEAFQVFLQNTDQKVKARAWLDGFVRQLPKRELFLDIGAGNGQVTAWYTEAFQKAIATEPNASLRADLLKACPGIEVLPSKILEAQLPPKGDLVLCSHVFYYLPGEEWMPSLAQLASWISEEGAAVVALQNHETDCMKMLEHFSGRAFNLAALAEQFRQEKGAKYEAKLETVAAHITTQDLESAVTIAGFILNLLPMSEPPLLRDLEEYVRERFSQPDGGCRFSCHQDFLQVRRRPRG